jgi:hypothetical protein
VSAPRSGLALLIVAGVLGILAVLAAAFVTLAQLERRASRQRLHATKALLLARSGIEDALARLSAGQDPSRPGSDYGGEDWDGDGALSAFEAQQEVYRPGSANLLDCPLRHAMRPSFFERVSPGSPNPATENVAGRLRGWSGELDAGAYTLKVEDESAKINVNGGFLDALDRDFDGIYDHRDPWVSAPPIPGLPPGSAAIGRGWNGALTRILNLLGDLPEVDMQGLGSLAMTARPAGGYRDMHQLQAALGTSKDLSPYLTVSSWVDPKVVHPNGYDGQAPVLALSELKRARLPLRLEEGGRPPVNLNAAARPILLSLIQGLKGTNWRFEQAPWTFEISPGLASGIAAAIQSGRPFSTWGDFSACCDSMAVSGIISGLDALGEAGDLCGADLLKANFDPNTRLNKHLPDQLTWRWIDKSDLTVSSTEGSLGPTGSFRIAVEGRVLGKGGRVLAARAVGTTAEVFALLRQTTQGDFVGGRALSDLPSPLSLASAAFSPPAHPPTLGASAPAGWWGAPPPGHGLAVVTTPCPVPALPGQAADFDGGIALATVELDPSSVPAACLFLQHFDDGWDADVGSPPARQPHPGNPALQVNAGTSAWPPPGSEPNTLYPDGAHLQRARGPAYEAAGNLPPSGPPTNHAVLGYWVKQTPAPDNDALFGTAAYALDFSLCRWNALGHTQGVAVGRIQELWGLVAECRAASGDTGFERQYHVRHHVLGELLLPGLRWHFVTGRFDTDDGTLGQDVRLIAQGLQGLGAPDSTYNYPDPFFPGAQENLASPDPLFVLGGQLMELDYRNARSVVDEFAICDFGDASGAALPLVEAWHTERYRDGRYYKGGDGRFLSTELVPDGGSPVRLLAATWTAYLPDESRREYVAQADGTPGNHASPAGSPRQIDPDLAYPGGGSRLGISLALRDAGGAATLQPLVRGAPIGRRLRGFRYEALFTCDLADPTTDPVLETPFLDDVTFSYQSATGPRLLAWE